MEQPSSADQKALALYYAYAALARALCKSGALTQDGLMTELAGANQQLHRIGEIGAATLFGDMVANLWAIDE